MLRKSKSYENADQGDILAEQGRIGSILLASRIYFMLSLNIFNIIKSDVQF